MGYTRYAYLRMTPLDGAPETLDLMTSFSDAGGPVRIRETFRLDSRRTSDVNRLRRSLPFGYRYRAELQFQIPTVSETSSINEIAERAAREDWTLELSVDSGSTYNEVILSALEGPSPLGGKVANGAEYSMTFEAVELLDAPPVLS